MERHQRGQCRQRQQHEEEQRDTVTHHREGGKCLLKHIRQRDEDERRTAIRINPYREGSREDHQSGKNSHHTVYQRYL